MLRKIKRYGWIPDLPDQRDFMYAAPLAAPRALPPKKDLSGDCPPVYDQGELGSCTANAIGGAHEFEQRKQLAPQRTRSAAGNAKKAFTQRRIHQFRDIASASPNGPLKIRQSRHGIRTGKASSRHILFFRRFRTAVFSAEEECIWRGASEQ